MKLTTLLFLYTNILISQVWIQMPDFPASKRDDGVAVVVNDKAYIGTGLQEWSATIDFYAFDLKSNQWSTIPTMPLYTERQYACAFPGNNCFYVFGGDGDGGTINNMFKYDIATSTWTNVSSKPGNGLMAAACMSFGDKVIFAGGKFQPSVVSNEVWEYTISTDTWHQKNNLPFSGRWRASATVLNTTGYFLFGIDTAGAFRKELYSYDPALDQWTKIMDFPQAKGRAYASLNVANSKITLFGGVDSLNNYYKDLWYFNSTTHTWLQGPDLPATGRKGGMSCGYDQVILYSCGISAGDKRLNETWMTHVPVGIKEKESTLAYSVYPVPAKDELHLEFHSLNANEEQIEYQVLDLCGNEVIVLSKLNQEKMIPLNQIQSGIYLLKIYSGDEVVAVKKINKE